MQVRFEIDVDSLTIEDELLVEDAQMGKYPYHALTRLFSRYMADEKGILLGEQRAMEILKPMKKAQIWEIASAFTEAIQRKAVPPQTSAD